MIRTVSSLIGAFYELFQQGGLPRGKSAGWVSLDPLYTIRPAEWTLVTGIPGHGKSSWLDNVIVNTAMDHDWKWLVFSAENRPIVRHIANLASVYIGRSFGPSVRARMDENDWLYASSFLDDHVQFLEPKAWESTLDHVLLMAESVRDLNALVIDPWNALDHSRKESQTETEHVAESLWKIVRLAQERNIHVFLVAHPQKLMRQKTKDGEDQRPVPTPYDVSGSAHFYNIADNCICVWRDPLDPLAASQIHVQKIRFREVGSIGACRLYYDPISGRFNDPLTGERARFDLVQYREDLDARIAQHEAEIEQAEEQLALQEERGRA